MKINFAKPEITVLTSVGVRAAEAVIFTFM